MPIEYLKLLEHCQTSGYQVFNQEFYLLIDMRDDIAIGLSSASWIYKRYVDDTFTILPRDNVYILLNHLNSINNDKYSIHHRITGK